jgi:hypothetical protein
VVVLLILGLTYIPDMQKKIKVGCPIHRYNKITGNASYIYCYFTYRYFTYLYVIIHIITQHTGHDPEEDRDVNMLRIDDRVGSSAFACVFACSVFASTFAVRHTIFSFSFYCIGLKTK